MKTALLQRYDNATFGVLKYGTKSWLTVERSWNDNASGTSSIPPGIYLCRWTKSPRLKKFTYEVLGVKGRTGIRIHSANFPHQLKGCISLGKRAGTMDGQRGVFLSVVAIREFNDAMNGEDFKLEIK